MDKWHFNGSDYLMLGFDRELRRRGYAGYSCQVVLELAAPLKAEALQRRLDTVLNNYPVLRARPGGLFRAQWKFSSTSPVQRVRVHRDRPGLREELFNDPMARRDGELVRFDLVERDGGRTDVVFTWAHTLMDAVAAEHFLAMFGHDELPLPVVRPAPPRHPGRGLSERIKLSWKSIHHLDEFCKAPPQCMKPRFPEAPARLRYSVEKFSTAETAQVRANGVRLCGMLGDAQYHAAVAVFELHQLHTRLGCPTPSYVVPVPVGMRRKGSAEPMFSNQMGMLMFQFLPGQMDTAANTAASLKRQTESAMRAGLLDSGLTLSDLFRFLPLPLYMAMVKQGLKGEICSLFFGDTAVVNPLLNRFLGVPVENFAHVGAVTPAPGLGVIFYYFADTLRVTVVHSAQILSDAEAAEFASHLRQRLLNP